MGTKSCASVALCLVVLTVTSLASNIDVNVLPTPQNSDPIHTIIVKERRRVLFNSRRLTGECLPICSVERKEAPLEPNDAPVVMTEAPVAPTQAPADPTEAPANGDCDCLTSDPAAGSFKCGNDVYVCPDVGEICSNQGSENSVYYELTVDQCNDMKDVAIDTKCISLPQYNLLDTKDLSNRVCYGGSEFGDKTDGEGCEECTGVEPPVFEETIAPDPTDAPTSNCDCLTSDPAAGSFKCGNDVYVCPDVDEICSNQGSENSVYYELTVDQCNDMKDVAIDTKCISLPQYNLLDTKDLSNRVCYGGSEFGDKTDGEGCEECTGVEPPVFEETIAPDPTDAPTSNCECDHDDDRIGSWKCGKNIYVCPGFTEICKNQVKPQFSYYPLDADQCEEMKSKRLGEKCILLPDYGITSEQGLGLSNRVCYDADHPFGTKTDDSTCGGDCAFTLSFTFEELVSRRRRLI